VEGSKGIMSGVEEKRNRSTLLGGEKKWQNEWFRGKSTCLEGMDSCGRKFTRGTAGLEGEVEGKKMQKKRKSCTGGACAPES